MSSRRVVLTPIHRLAHGASETDVDLVAAEAPLTIQLHTSVTMTPRSLGVMMRTPGDDRDLVLGLLCTEGLIRTREDIVDIALTTDDAAGDVADVQLSDAIDLEGTIRARALLATSACGLCGRLAIERVDALARRAPSAPSVRWPAELIVELPARLRASQAVFAETGGLHAAGLFDEEGTIIAVREDIGRHNAVDKLVGAALDAALLPAVRSLLVVSGRVAYEIVQKAAMAGVPGIVAVGAPSSLAVEAAQSTGLTLIGFARDGRFNVYTGSERLA